MIFFLEIKCLQLNQGQESLNRVSVSFLVKGEKYLLKLKLLKNKEFQFCTNQINFAKSRFFPGYLKKRKRESWAPINGIVFLLLWSKVQWSMKPGQFCNLTLSLSYFF